jgi:ubiquinone/menaquinone biosynthesis C-methylase UbiE
MNKTQQAIKVFDTAAEKYQDKFMDVSLYQASLDIFCNALPKNARILELACGPGNITKYLLQQRPDLKILGTDLAPKMLELAQINNPTAQFELMDAKAINNLNQQFDGIMCGFCTPYLTKEETIKLIADANNCLSKKGVFYLSTMEDDYSKSGPQKSSDGTIELHIYYHQADYLIEAFKTNGFTIIKKQQQHFPIEDGEGFNDLILIAKKL